MISKNKDELYAIVSQKLKERDQSFFFLKEEYLKILINIITESIDEFCIECQLYKGEIK